MRRKLFTLAAAVSAVLCVAGCLLWYRSYSPTFPLTPAHTLSRTDGKRWVELSSAYGDLYFLRVSGFEITDNGVSAPYRFTLKFRDITNGLGIPSLLSTIFMSPARPV